MNGDIGHLEDAIRSTNGYYPKAFYALGMAHARLQNWPQARTAFLTTLKADKTNGEAWFAGLLAIVFAGDTTAYFAGRLFGKRKLHEAISPKKTIEGSLGSLAGAAIAGFVMAKFFIPEVHVMAMIALALVTNLFAQVGDLFESLLKRVSASLDLPLRMPPM